LGKSFRLSRERERAGVRGTYSWLASGLWRRRFGSRSSRSRNADVLLVDPFSDDPTIVTGSHNFSNSASTSNDETFIAIKGDRALAEAYAVNIDSA
jgi:hypothetical protein